MLINFLDPCFNPKIETTAVSDDTYHFNNLISNNARDRNLGFMCYSVTKPPITLIFKLNCKIELKTIKIWTQLGALKTTKLAVFVRSEKMIVKVGESNLQDKIGVIFKNECSDSAEIDGNMKNENFYRKSYFSLKHVNEIHIMLRETARCPPVLRKIEMWGTPSRSLSRQEVISINELWKAKFTRPMIPKFKDNSESGEKESFTEEELTTFEIPEEFLDQITYHIMVLPMVLPSGKVVDQSTIEKYNICEAGQGRSSSDPFTGLHYTDKRMPILDAALKSRIDQFMLLHSNEIEIKKSGRTIGKKRKIEETETSAVSAAYLPSTSSSSCSSSRTTSISDQSLENQSSSLDSLINNALKNMTRFTQLIPKKTESTACVECKCSEQSNLYKINGCNHIICRNCLTDKDPLVCFLCKIEFCKKDVEKFHK